MKRDEMTEFDALCEIVDYRFKNHELLELAVAHSSSKIDNGYCNERLEFLGDSVLGLLISEHLFEKHPDLDEGRMTQIKSVVVSGPVLAAESRKLGLEKFINVGKGVEKQGTLPVSLLANVFEAIVGAIYLDGGLAAAKDFVLGVLGDQVELGDDHQYPKNYKSLLQEFTQQKFGEVPVYHVIREEGPDHKKKFIVAARVHGNNYESAVGRSKKEAEQKAAKLAYKQLCD